MRHIDTPQEVYDSIEAEARLKYLPGSWNLSPRLTMGLLTAAMVIGGVVGGANLSLDNTVTFKTPNGETRTQPYWLVPKGVEVIRSDGGSGIVRGFGWIGMAVTGGLLVHLAGKQLSWEKFIGQIQTDAHITDVKTRKAAGEMAAMARLAREHKHEEMRNNFAAVQADQDFYEAIGFDPTQQQSTLPYSVPAPPMLSAAVNPTATATAKSASKDGAGGVLVVGVDYQLPNLVDYPSLLVFGVPGSGKSTFLHTIVDDKIAAGHEVEILDPHFVYGDWKGLNVYGKGLNYDELADRLKRFVAEVKNRFERLSTEKDVVFAPLSIICDEFTSWGQHVAGAAAFLRLAITEIRKINCFVVIAGHTDTLTGLGGKDSAGLSGLAKKTLLIIELIGKQDAITGKAVPAFEMRVKPPGWKASNALAVTYEPNGKISKPGNSIPEDSVLMCAKEELELDDVWGETATSEPSEPLPERGGGRFQDSKTNDKIADEPLEPSQGQDSKDSEVVYTLRNLTEKEAILAVQDSLAKGNKTSTIEKLWGCTKGGSEAYRRANEEYNYLISKTSTTADWLGF